MPDYNKNELLDFFDDVLEHRYQNNSPHPQYINIKQLPGHSAFTESDLKARIYNLKSKVVNDKYFTCSICGHGINEGRLEKYPLAISCDGCQPELNYELDLETKALLFDQAVNSACSYVSERDMPDLSTITADQNLFAVGAALATATARNLLIEKGIIPAGLLHRGDSKLPLEQDLQKVLRFYPNENVLAGKLPYVEVANFCDEFRNGEIILPNIVVQEGEFELGSWNEDEIDNLRDRGLKHLREIGKVRHDSSVIRVDSIQNLDGQVTLSIQKARYTDQAKSNLILDFNPDNGLSLRSKLREDYQNMLPGLEDEKMANTLGVAMLVFYKNNGQYEPIIVPRSKNTAVFGGGWHCTASGAAEWPEDYHNVQDNSFSSYILDDLYRELTEEVGLTQEDLIGGAKLVSVCRELARGGKPQLFYIAFTYLTREIIQDRMKRAIESLDKQQNTKEIYHSKFLSDLPDINSVDELIEHGGGFTHEALALLHFYLKITDKLPNKKLTPVY